jgi:hypothetical protein
MMTHKVILSGVYETDGGGVPIHEEGASLNEIVYRLQKEDEDFGHTDMEFELELPSGEIKDVSKLISRIVTNA